MSSPTTTMEKYRLRPGTSADIPVAVSIFQAAFAHDMLFDLIVPNRRTHPHVLTAFLRRLFTSRYFSNNYNLTMLTSSSSSSSSSSSDDGAAEAVVVVGFTWWKTPPGQMSFYRRWLSPWGWFCAFLDKVVFKVRDWLFPIEGLNPAASALFARTVATMVEPKVMINQRRKDAFYLSTLAVLPSLQGRGLGGLLLRHGLEKIDARGAAAWLIGLKGIEPYYERFGFETKAHANVGDLSHWDGGAVMFRNG